MHPPEGISYPAAVLENAELRLVVDLPDPEKGRYRGTRFDLSGQVLSARYRGREFFGAWKAVPEDGLHRDGAGPAEEFSMSAPPGYAEAVPGGVFLKIGVGVLERTDERPYLFHRDYPVVSRGEWETRRGRYWVETVHTLETGTGWGYRYRKRVEIDPVHPVMTIRRTLWNTGARRIETDHYSHNFVLMGDAVPDERIELETTIVIDPPHQLNGAIQFEGKAIRFPVPMPARRGGHHADLFELSGTEGDLPPSYNRGRWRNLETGMELAFTGSLPLRKLVFYGLGGSLSLEPFVPVEVDPGGSLSWTTTYTFSRSGEAEKGDKPAS